MAKDRVCIYGGSYGGSYGGYAALMGVIKEPDLFQCAVSFAGVYDLNLKFDKGDFLENNWSEASLVKIMGDNEKFLAQKSPVNLVEKIKVPLFLSHGTKDERVPFEHYEKLVVALKKNRIEYESLVLKGEAHGFQNSKNGIKFYKKVLEFLDDVFEL
ncbi:alpha/beta hydrolase family protein [Aliikangiella maris]|uniref:Prolyl oligopeptidase family serine peptidase n=2 Tax=Aliikangiella maris TaxID=3162458 RepID=A0ABV2BPA5_9GAMM